MDCLKELEARAKVEFADLDGFVIEWHGDNWLGLHWDGDFHIIEGFENQTRFTQILARGCSCNLLLRDFQVFSVEQVLQLAKDYFRKDIPEHGRYYPQEQKKQEEDSKSFSLLKLAYEKLLLQKECELQDDSKWSLCTEISNFIKRIEET